MFYKYMLTSFCAVVFAVILTGIHGCGALSSLNNDSTVSVSGSSSLSQATEIPFDEALENPGSTSGNDAESVVQLLAEAQAHIQSHDIAAAIQKMEAVVNIDPQNPSANLVLGISDVNDIVTNKPLVDAVNDLIALNQSSFRFQSNGIGDGDISQGVNSLNVLNPTVLFLSTTFNAQVAQAVAAITPFLPRLDSAITRLQFALLAPNFSYPVPSGVLKDSTIQMIERDHLLAIYAALNLVRGVSYQVLAYNLSVKDAAYQSAAHLLSENPAFLTLQPDGKRKMRLAGISYRNIFTSIIELSKFADLHPERTAVHTYLGNLFQDGKNLGILELEKWRRSLAGNTESIVISLSVTGPHTTLGVNFGNFFNNPPNDFRKFLGINVVGELSSASFPPGYDFSLNGLFPNFKSFDDWQRYNFEGFLFYNPQSGMDVESKATYTTRMATDGSWLVISDDKNGTEVFGIGVNQALTKIGTIPQHGLVAVRDNDLAIFDSLNRIVYVYQVRNGQLHFISSKSLSEYWNLSNVAFTESKLVIFGYGGVYTTDRSDLPTPAFSYVPIASASLRDVYDNRIYQIEYEGYFAWWGTKRIYSYDIDGGDRRLEATSEYDGWLDSFKVGRLNGKPIFLLNTNWRGIFVIGDGVPVNTSIDARSPIWLSVENNRVAVIQGSVLRLVSVSGVGSKEILYKSIDAKDSSAVVSGEGAWVLTGRKLLYKSF